MPLRTVADINGSGKLPRWIDGDTLASLGEIRARYAEVLGLAEYLQRGGRRTAGRMRRRLDRIDQVYDTRTGRLWRADASVADVARDVRRFSIKVGGMQVR